MDSKHYVKKTSKKEYMDIEHYVRKQVLKKSTWTSNTTSGNK